MSVTRSYPGVTLRNGKWFAYLNIYLGQFDTPEEAHRAWVAAKAEEHRIPVQKSRRVRHRGSSHATV